MAANAITREGSVLPLGEAEQRLARLSGRGYALLANRATTALVALLRALQLPDGSEVLLPASLCANPAHAVRWAGLRPLFADVNRSTFTVDLESAEGHLRPQTRVMLAVPLFGHPLDADAILAFADKHGLVVIEDAAQATGLCYGNRPAGSLGVASVFSFGRGKIADASGGAALLSDDADLLARAARELRAINRTGRHGANPANIVRALDALPEELRARGETGLRYRQLLNSQGIAHPHVEPGLPLWKYSVLLPNRAARDRVTRALVAGGIEATNLYPPLPAYFPEARNAAAAFPAAFEVFQRIVNLPLWPQVDGLDERVSEAFRVTGDQ